MRASTRFLVLLGTAVTYAACGSAGETPHGTGGAHDSGDGDETSSTNSTTEDQTSDTSSGSAGSGSGDGDTNDTEAGGSGGPGTGASAGSGGTFTGGGAPGTGGTGTGGEVVECDDEVTVFEGTDISDAIIAEDGQPCDSWGALACGGADDKRALFCDQGQWIVLTECGEGESCDRLTGVCTEIFEGCEDKQPGETFCDGDLSQECGPDRINLSQSTACCGVCVDGACQEPVCGDGKVNLAEACDDGNDVSVDGCESNCQTSGIVDLAAGEHHTCALLVGGHVKCWGKNEDGQLGQGHTEDLTAQHPYQIPLVNLGGPAVGIDAGRNHTCALMEDGTMQCWGKNDMGQLGLGHTNTIGDNEVPSASTSRVPLGSSKVLQVSAGGENSCALLENRSLRCWGRNNHGQLGLGHTNTIGDNETPSQANAQVPLGEEVSEVAVGGGEHVCAILPPGGVKCWGSELTHYVDEDIGDDEAANEGEFYTYRDGPLHSLVANGPRSCSIVQDGGNQCMGYDGDGGLALGITDKFGHVIYRWEGRKAWQVAVGSQHICVNLSDYTLRCFGYNDKAQLGIEDTNYNYAGIGYSMPVEFGTNEFGNAIHAVLVAAGDQFTCAVTERGDLHCWGRNDAGQLGLGYVSPGPLDYVGGTEDSIPSKRDPVKLFSLE